MSTLQEHLRAVLEGRPTEPPEGQDAPAGALVRLRSGERVGGFVGRLTADQPFHLAAADAARRARDEDPRFEALPPGAPVELDVWRVGASRRIRHPDALRPGRDGVAIRAGHRRSVMVPGLYPELDADPGAFLGSACVGAGLPPEAWRHEDVEVLAFQADRL